MHINFTKFFYTAVFILLISGDSFSQRLKWEDLFEPEDIISNGWQIINNDSSAGSVLFYTAFEFFNLSQLNSFRGNYFLKFNFENANLNNLADDWIISPKIYGIRENDTISFWCGAIDLNYKDSLKIYISETDNNLNSFELIDHFRVDGPAGSWHKKSYDLSAYKGKNIYFAVNYYLVNAGPLGSSSDNVWIDYFTLRGKGYGGADVTEYMLHQNFPNPFNPATDISFSLPFNSDVNVTVYDVSGKEVSSFINGFFEKGNYSFTFNGSDLASGVYFYRLTASGPDGVFSDVKKMQLIK
ncbi:MAG: T9SS type A sorting domain-containing protein [Ignavibacteria bacterium]|nr:T9SS type A sorting domain-containing protein [Ignavibacteria bacterium]